MTPLTEYTRDIRRIIDVAATAGGMSDPVAFDPDEFTDQLLGKSVRGRFVPIDGVFIRDWDPEWRRQWSGMNFGIRLYHIHGITFARVSAAGALGTSYCGYNLFVVDRRDYRPLYRTAVGIRRSTKKAGVPPVMPKGHQEQLWGNTIGFLDSANLRQIRELGGRAKRGLLLTGPPGNGKTTACRWVYQECRRRNWDCRLVSADDYQAARRDDDPGEAVRRLFRVTKRGVIFFDDMDIALRDRDTVKETDDQTVFLTAMDGVEVHDGVVYVFTTNCPLDLIDPAFRRPGRIDLALSFRAPDAHQRRELIGRWHRAIRDGIAIEEAVAQMVGLSFAEVEEVKNLLIQRFINTRGWDWAWALEQFNLNRAELAKRQRHVGFASLELSANGHR